MQRISLFTDGVWPYVMGGMARHSYYLAKYLAREKVYVDLFHFNASDHNPEKLEFFEPEEREYIRNIVLKWPDGPKYPGHYLKESMIWSRTVYDAWEKLEERSDLIYAQGFCAWYLFRERDRGHSTPPVAVNFHGMEMFQRLPGFKARLQAMLLRSPVKYNLQKADYVISFPAQIRKIVEGLGISDRRIIEMNLGIGEDWIEEEVSPAGKPRKFVYLGRYERRKGVEELARVLKQNLSSLNAEFHFIGPIPEKIQAGIPGAIFHGEVRDSAELRSLLRQMDVLVLPSHSEGMPNVLLEAMASGLSLIATDVGAVSAVVKKDWGWLIPPADEVALENALKDAVKISDPDLQQKKKAGQDFVREHLTWTRVIRDFIQKMDALLGG